LPRQKLCHRQAPGRDRFPACLCLRDARREGNWGRAACLHHRPPPPACVQRARLEMRAIPRALAAGDSEAEPCDGPGEDPEPRVTCRPCTLSPFRCPANKEASPPESPCHVEQRSRVSPRDRNKRAAVWGPLPRGRGRAPLFRSRQSLVQRQTLPRHRGAGRHRGTREAPSANC